MYRTVVRLVMIYGIWCWTLKKKDEREETGDNGDEDVEEDAACDF